MKRELETGDSQTITITENGTVTVPHNVRMSISEIADLFGIFYHSVKRCVRDIEKSGIANGDYSMHSTVEGLKVCPDYYGLDMITAIAFRVQSAKVEIFRNYLLRRMTATNEVSMVWKIPLFGTVLN